MQLKTYKKFYRHLKKNKNRRIQKSSFLNSTSYLIANSYGFLDKKQIEATRRVISRMTMRLGKIYVAVKPNIPLTAKPLEARMGKGKGKIKHRVCNIYPGQILFYVKGVSKDIATQALILAAKKLPITSRVKK